VEQPSYRLAVDVCNATADRLQRNVCQVSSNSHRRSDLGTFLLPYFQYFTETILRHGEDEDLDEISTAHDLIKQLNRACPSLLLNVVPQLEEELRVDELQIRLMATQVLGEMFSDKRGAELAKKYPTTWQTWLVRKNDKAPAVRVAFVEGSVNLLKNHPSLRVEIEGSWTLVTHFTFSSDGLSQPIEALHSKILDPDDKVRASACKVYGQIDYETALHHVSVSQLKELCSRFLDKKVGSEVRYF
jgi:sister-chromatid-cohesion protein PDS5